MNLRDALEILGVERVRKGMRAIDDRRPAMQLGLCATCFVGEAFGQPDNGTSVYAAAVHRSRWGQNLPSPNLVQLAARTCEIAYEGDGATLDTSPCPTSRTELRDACVQFLAEHGNAPEPALAPSGIPSVSLSGGSPETEP